MVIVCCGECVVMCSGEGVVIILTGWIILIVCEVGGSGGEKDLGAAVGELATTDTAGGGVVAGVVS